MSGGHFDYEDQKLEELADKIYEEKTDVEKELASLLRSLAQVLHDYDYWKSGDHSEHKFLESWNNFKAELKKEKN